jgi:hypothetical protein
VPVKDPEIFRIIERMGSHYQQNVANRFVRKALAGLELQQSDWDRLEGLLTGMEYHQAQGYQFDELYEVVLSAARFIVQARQRILPNLRSISAPGAGAIGRGSPGAGDQDRVLRDMAAKTFPVNLGILADLANELYVATTGLDRKLAGKRTPVYERIPELKQLGRYLVAE